MTVRNQEAFLEIVDLICHRPGMYVGSDHLKDVVIYLNGLAHGLALCNSGEVLTKSWPRWLEGRYLRGHQAHEWSEVLCDLLGSQNAVFAVLPSLYREYFEDLSVLGDSGIEVLSSHRLLASNSRQGQDT